VTNIDKPSYPQSEILSARQDERVGIVDFLEWLMFQKGLRFARWDSEIDQVSFVTADSDQLWMEYAGIDRKALEQERREMLRKLED
jgi:hypothetical protein